jgi:Xaa-Pro aminopeptidase
LAVTERLQKLRQKIIEHELDAILISQPENLRYLSGFTGSAGALLISQDSVILATDFRYIEQAKEQSPDFEIIQVKGDISQWLPGVVSGLVIKRLGFEANTLCYASYSRLAEELNELQLKLQLTSTEGLVESLRAVKEEEEIAHLIKAAELADAAAEYITHEIRPGMKEKEVAWKVERFLRENGSETVPFDIIVASGCNSALPHARPTERPISAGEPIIIDLGARVDGYCSDLSRTICLGSHDKTFIEIYDLVLEAQLTALEALEPGVDAKQIDSIARAVVERGSYRKAFGHGLGHGVGLAAHEEPYLGPTSSGILAEGMVFTIEPGIYLAGWGGVRIEDMVILDHDKPRWLTRAKKDRG